MKLSKINDPPKGQVLRILSLVAGVDLVDIDYFYDLVQLNLFVTHGEEMVMILRKA